MEHLLNRLRPAQTTARKVGGQSYLYYARIRDRSKVYYKVGYTSIGVAGRVKQLGLGRDIELEIVDSLVFSREQDAFVAEQTLHLFFRTYYPRHRYKYKELGKLVSSGNSEIYTVNLLDMPELLKKVDRYNMEYWERLRVKKAKARKYAKMVRRSR